MTQEEQDPISKGIQTVITELMDRVMNKVLSTDPFLPEEHRLKKPLYAALVPDEIFKGSHFERRFVTPFGGVWEKLAEIVAQSYHHDCQRGHSIKGHVGRESLRRIQEVLNNLEHRGNGSHSPNWTDELAYIKDGGGALIPTEVVCDIFIDSQTTNQKYAFELKAPLPNSDQTKVSKEKMFKLLAMDSSPVDFAYYALPYNPYGKKEDYAWSFPMRWFDMKKDPCVLIGDEFWDIIGGPGTYEKFINEVNALGSKYKKEIYTEFLGMNIPDNISSGTL